MVMLDIFRQSDAVVAHFDHGTRPSSRDDADFVRHQAQAYNLPFVLGEAQLGENVSEAAARQARYDFLRQVAATYNCTYIYTAHHLHDLVESVTINLVRGTGWRGLAVLDTPDIRRPFLETDYLPKPLQNGAAMNKKDILHYAAEHDIKYRQDPTNTTNDYLRNRLREKLNDFPDKTEIFELWQKQKQYKREVDQIVQDLLPEPTGLWQRSWFYALAPDVALELLRAGTLRAGIAATRPQLENFRQAISTYKPGKCFNLPEDHLVKFTKTSFTLPF